MSDIFLKAFLIVLFSAVQLVVWKFSVSLQFLLYPNLLILLIIYLGFRYGSMTGQLSGFFGGLLIEAFIPPLGAKMLVYTLIGFSIGLLHKRLFNEGLLSNIIMVAVCTVGYGLLLQVIYITFFPEHYSSKMILQYLTSRVLLEIAVNLAFAIPIFYLFRWMDMKIRKSF